MLRYLFLIICCCKSLSLCANNVAVGYENNGNDDIATLWITDNNLNTTPVSLAKSESKAFSLVQYGNTLFIVGYQNLNAKKQATLWTCDLRGNNIKSISLDTSPNDSEASCITWTGTYFYAGGYIENTTTPYATVWQIDITGKILNTSTSQYASNIKGISWAGKLSNLALTGQVTIPSIATNAACVFQFDTSGQFTPLLIPKPLLNPDQSSTPAQGNSIILENSNSDNPIFYIAGAYDTDSPSPKACIWKGNFWTLDDFSSQSLSLIKAEARDLTIVNNQLYISGFITNSGNNNACIWTAPTGNLSSFETFSTTDYLYPINTRYANCVSCFNFIKGTQGSKNLQSFPLYAGGYFTFDLIPDAFYEKFSTTQNIVNFGANNFINPPIVDLSNSVTSYQKEAFDMLINVLSPSKVIYKAIKSNKTLSIQIGTSK